jgi:tetratricopeptide (TPR) repeat protein
MQLEIELRSDHDQNDIYELRNLLQREGITQVHLKEQAPQQGEMAVGIIDSIIVGAIEGIVGHSVNEIYTEMVKPKISKWLQSKKSKNKLEVLSTLKDAGTQIHFLEDNKGSSQVFENLKYAIDIDHTRAVLIGNSEFDGGFSPIPPVKGNIEDFYHLLTDKLHIGLAPEKITLLFNKTNTEIEETLLQQSRIPDTETLIIYFAGHGHRTDVKKLYLVAKNSKRIDDYLLGGIDFDFISNVVLRNATAKQKILILDACHSGIATQGTDDMIDKIDVKGSYVLASSPGDEVSYFEKNSRNTYFTGVLLDVLKSGIENTSEMIALEDLYEYSKNHLTEKNFPHPIYKNELNIPASNFFIARNPLFSYDKLKQRPGRLLAQGRFEEALYEYRMLLQRFPEDMELRQKASECETNALFNRLVQDGDELFFHIKDYKGAIEKYKKALQIKEDMLVRGKLSRCQDYLKEPISEEKKIVQKMTATVVKKPEPVVKPVIKTDPLKEKKLQQEEKPTVDNSDKLTGVLLASLWLIFALIFIFSTFGNASNGLKVFNKASVPVGIIGIILIVVRWKRVTITETLLYAHGFFFCVLPLIAELSNNSRDKLNGAVLLFLAYNIGYLVLLIRKLKEFKLADMIIASVEILYLCYLFFSLLFYMSFQREYGMESKTASTIAIIIGLAAAVGGIILMRKRWIELRKK